MALPVILADKRLRAIAHAMATGQPCPQIHLYGRTEHFPGSSLCGGYSPEPDDGFDYSEWSDDITASKAPQRNP